MTRTTKNSSKGKAHLRSHSATPKINEGGAGPDILLKIKLDLTEIIPFVQWILFH